VSKLLAWASAAGQRVNPIVVKEFRQAVRSRFVVAVLMLFLLVDLAILAGFLLLSPDLAAEAESGRNVFSALFAVLLFTCMGFVPLYAGVRLSLERNDTNIDLFFITTVSPGAIVRGKYFTAMALTLLIFSACMPLLAFTYLLRGIDLPTIFFVLAVAFLVCAAGNALGVFAGCLPGGWLFRGLLAAASLFVLIFAASGTFSVVMRDMLMFGRYRTWDWDFLAGFGTIVFLELLGIGLLQVLSAAMLSPKPANRMLVPRLYTTICWAAAGLLVGAWCWHEGRAEMLLAWLIPGTVLFSGFAVMALGERDTWSRRLRKRIPRNPLLRLPAFLFYTGAAGGLLWSTLMFAATLGVCCAWGGRVGGALSRDQFEGCRNAAICFGYVLCYCLTTASVRGLFLKKLPTLYLPIIAMLLGVAATLVPYLVAFFVMDQRMWRSNSYWYLMGSPAILTTGRLDAVEAAVPLVMAWLCLSALGSVPWWLGQWRRFVPLEAESPWKQHSMIPGELSDDRTDSREAARVNSQGREPLDHENNTDR
jgi:hypothetical protein